VLCHEVNAKARSVTPTEKVIDYYQDDTNLSFPFQDLQ
jgi:hypothetical protein